MNANAWVQFAIFFAVLLLTVKPLGKYMARIYQGTLSGPASALGRCEGFLYRLAGVRRDEETGWRRYAVDVLIFNFLALLLATGVSSAPGQ